MKKAIITIAIIAASIVGLFFILAHNKAKNEAQTAVATEKNDGVLVRIAVAETRAINMEYVVNGTFAPKQEVFISTELPGKVIQVLVQEGSKVSAGQTLAVIKGDQQSVAVANAQAVFDNAQNEVSRFESAYETGGVTKQQLDQIRLQLENAKNNLQSAQLNAGNVNIKASFPGIVNKKNIEPGSYVNPGQALFEIVNISTLKLRVNVDEKTIGKVRQGQKVAVKCPVLPDEQWEGKVSFIAPRADASLSFPVELEIENKGAGQLKAGMFGTAIFGKDETVNALVIPRSAFVGNVSSRQVFVEKNNEVTLTTINIGRDFGEYIEVVSGIEAGDRVIVSGQINLFDGTRVEIIP